MSMNNPMSSIPPLGQQVESMPAAPAGKFKPVDPLRVIRANWLWIVIAFVVGVALGVGAWFLLDKFAAKYTSDAQYDVQAMNVDMVSGQPTGPTRMVDLEPIILREVENAKSEPLLRQILNTQEVQSTEWFTQFQNNMDAAYEDLSENVIRSRAIPGTPLFNVSMTTSHESDAQVLLAAHRDEFMRRQQARIEAESSRDLLAAQRRLNSAEERIASIEGAITRFLSTTPIESVRGGDEEATLRVRDLVVRLSEIGESLNSLRGSYQELLAREEAGDFSPTGEERQQIEARQEIVNINQQLLQLRLQREPLLKKFKPEHRVIEELDSQILKLENEREAKIDEFARSLFRAKIEQTKLQIDIFKEAFNKTTEELTELKVQRQEAVELKYEYDTLNRQLEQAEAERVAARQAIEQLRLMERNEARVLVRVSVPPQQAKQSFPPDPPIMVLGVTFLVTGLVTGLIFLREVTDQRVRSASDVKLVPDANLIGAIPDADEDVSRGQKVERVVEQFPSGLLAEAYRQVRTPLLSKIDRRGYKTLMMVSAKPGAGVTTAAQNLAASCALSGRRVLLIDANFRRPALAELMGLPGQPGLAELLGGDKALDQARSLTHASSTDNLSLLPAGDCANAAVELFESPRFRELLGKLEADFDLLIIDAPPALLTSDARLLSRHVDAMVLVTRAQRDTRGILGRLYRELDGQRADILGTVLNGVQASAGGYLKRNFREFHDYAGPERRKAPRAATPKRRAAETPAATNGPVAVPDNSQTEDDDLFNNGLETHQDDTPQR